MCYKDIRDVYIEDMGELHGLQTPFSLRDFWYKAGYVCATRDYDNRDDRIEWIARMKVAYRSDDYHMGLDDGIADRENG